MRRTHCQHTQQHRDTRPTKEGCILGSSQSRVLTVLRSALRFLLSWLVLGVGSKISRCLSRSGRFCPRSKSFLGSRLRCHLGHLDGMWVLPSASPEHCRPCSEPAFPGKERKAAVDAPRQQELECGRSEPRGGEGPGGSCPQGSGRSPRELGADVARRCQTQQVPLSGRPTWKGVKWFPISNTL